MEETVSKLVLDEKRLQLASDQVDRVLTGIFTAVGFPKILQTPSLLILLMLIWLVWKATA
ncbi:MAG: hypothetical protein CM15mP85_23690 [Rhodobacterales bacterium]|nr:MAG: hypothetical protein CM15mP85_23690 [Rhodobacterales bacterium]